MLTTPLSALFGDGGAAGDHALELFDRRAYWMPGPTLAQPPRFDTPNLRGIVGNIAIPSEAFMRALLSIRVWLVASLVWGVLVAWLCWESWPRLPLDVSSADPETLTAHKYAVEFHVFQHSVLGLMPPVVALAVGWVIIQVAKRSDAAPPTV